MRQIHRMLLAGVAVLLMQAIPAVSVFAQGAQAGGQGGGDQQGQGYVGGDQEAAGPSGGSRPSLEMPVLYVTGVEVLRTAMDPKIDRYPCHRIGQFARLEQPAACAVLLRKAGR